MTFRFVGFAAFFISLIPSDGAVSLPAIFGDHMVLQEGAKLPIWGKASPGEKITITAGTAVGETTADNQGKWHVDLPPLPAGDTPITLTVNGTNSVTFHDAVVGQVWIASGQSNMELTLKETHDAPAEIARSTDPLLRQFKVRNRARDVPDDDLEGHWVLADPTSSGDFSAVGYYFGQRLRHELHQPVGIIDAAWGGTIIEAWTSSGAVHSVPSLQAEADARHAVNAAYPPLLASFTAAYTKWQKSAGREDHPTPTPGLYAGDEINPADWSTVSLPGSLAVTNLPANGVLWLRKEVDLPPGIEKLVVKIGCGRISGFQTVYWNGKKVAETTPALYPGLGHVTYFAVVPQQTRPGKNILAIRIYAPAEPFALAVGGPQFIAGPVSLSGPWLARAEYTLPPLAPAELAQVPTGPKSRPGLDASVIFNGVVHPLIPFRMAGVIWYQGESNTGNAYEFRTEFPLMINDWRTQWGRPDLPFYFCQLANFLSKKNYPGPSIWAELREAQSMTLSLPDTAQAVLIDLGESDDAHFRDKKDVGERLALIALARNYGRKVVYSGPVYESAKVNGSRVEIKFTHVEGGLVSRPLPKVYPVRTQVGESAPLIPNSPGSQVEGFAVCGTDQHWQWADARIEGDTLLVWSDKVPAPVAVRYGWAENPTCNLYNGAGLPASPFRTDDFPGVTIKNHF